MAANAQFIDAVRELDRLSIERTESDLVQQGVEIAQAATGSAIAYLHFLNADQDTIELGVWSRAALRGCTAYHDRHYPVSAAGIWADSARTGLPCVHNDYASFEKKRGLPEGHSPLVRHLGVPVLEDGLVRMLVGVGNKPAPFDDDDVATLDMVARRIWSLVRQRRTLEHYVDLARRFRQVQEVAAVCGLEYDPGEDALRFDGAWAQVFGAPEGTPPPATLAGLLGWVAPGDRERVAAALAGATAGRQVLRVACERPGGGGFAADLKVEFRPREIGDGLLGVGTLQNIEERLRYERLRSRVDIDALTGLPTRGRLEDLFAEGGRDPAFAYLFVDLDGFRAVNERYGHLFGDEVLRVAASRLARAAQGGAVAARIGGDEFVIVQPGAGSAAAKMLASRILAVLGEPMVVLERPVTLRASVGVAVFSGEPRTLAQAGAVADAALAQAKAAGGGRYVVADLSVP